MKLLLAFLLLTVLNTAGAVSAIPGERSFKQVDGTFFTGKLKGNEWFNWIEDEQGLIVQYNSQSKMYEYMQLIEVDGLPALAPSGIHATNNNALRAPELGVSDGGQNLVPISPQVLSEIYKIQRAKMHQ